MTPRKRAQWVKALRSGKYKQCAGALCKSSGGGPRHYCVMGVLAHVDKRKFSMRPLVTPTNPRLRVGFVKRDDERESDVWYEGSSEAGSLVPSTHIHQIVTMNERRTPFSVIADWIEANIPVEMEGD